MGNTNNRNGPGRLKRMWRKLATMIVAVVVSLSLGTGIAFADFRASTCPAGSRATSPAA